MGERFTVQKEIVQASVTKTADFTQVAPLPTSRTARAIEIWLNVTAFSGFTSVDIAIDASMDEVNFTEIGIISGITGVTGAGGAKTLVFNRADDALGVVIRYRLIKTGTGSITYDILMSRME